MSLSLVVALLMVQPVWTSSGLDLLRSGVPEVENVLVAPEGAVRLSAGLEVRAEFEDNAVWDIAVAPGGRLGIGTGSAGRFYLLGPGRAAPVPTSVLEGDVLAALYDSRAGMLFGLTPGGTVYSLGSGDEPAEAFASGEDYVFDLLAGPGGEVYCATGSVGHLYRFRPGADGEVVFTAPQAHLTCLTWLDPGRTLLVGTSPDGIVYRLDLTPGAKPEVSVIYDTPYEEIRALVVGSDAGAKRIHIAANPGEDDDGSGAVLCVGENGVRFWEWTVPDSSVYDLAPRDGGVLVATGREGLVYQLDERGRAAVFQKLPAGRVLCLSTDGDVLHAGTSEPASIARIGPGIASAGTVESPVRDCEGPATFGRIEYRATVPSGTVLALDTRSGNSEKPDSTWSDWRETDGTVRSRPARFVQWRARLSSSFPGRTPVLERVDIYYRVPNRAPVITDFDYKPVEPAEAARGAARPVRELTWEAEDPDSDSLHYTLAFRPAGGANWLELAHDLAEATYELDTRLLADGWYRLRLTATDAPARPATEALAVEFISPELLVDNTPPQVTALRIEDGRLAVIVRDALSVVAAARVSVNAGPWQPVAPADGLFDSPEESFALAVTLRPGENYIAVWAADAHGNASSNGLATSGR